MTYDVNKKEIKKENTFILPHHKRNKTVYKENKRKFKQKNTNK